MRTKTNILTALAFAGTSVLFFSCGSKPAEENTGTDSLKTKDSVTVNTAPAATFAEACKSESAIATTVKMYEKGMKLNYSNETPNFEVKQYTLEMYNDSSAEMRLMNYTADELKGDKNDKQLEIIVNFTSKNGKKIGPGVYSYLMDKGDYSASAKISTSKGNAYFNWAMGQADPGNITLNFFSKSGACGTFNLIVDEPKDYIIGTVKLTGSFKVGS